MLNYVKLYLEMSIIASHFQYFLIACKGSYTQSQWNPPQRFLLHIAPMTTSRQDDKASVDITGYVQGHFNFYKFSSVFFFTLSLVYNYWSSTQYFKIIMQINGSLSRNISFYDRSVTVTFYYCTLRILRNYDTGFKRWRILYQASVPFETCCFLVEKKSSFGVSNTSRMKTTTFISIVFIHLFYGKFLSPLLLLYRYIST